MIFTSFLFRPVPSTSKAGVCCKAPLLHTNWAPISPQSSWGSRRPFSFWFLIGNQSSQGRLPNMGTLFPKGMFAGVQVKGKDA